MELTLALLKVFDLPKDKIIWDVSHQAYAYKILTGRLKDFHTLRQYGGISGFSRPEESIYDTTIAGHASTSISSAIGITLANDILGNEGKAVAVIGDGALTGGVALEALNNIGAFKKNIIIGIIEIPCNLFCGCCKEHPFTRNRIGSIPVEQFHISLSGRYDKNYPWRR